MIRRFKTGIRIRALGSPLIRLPIGKFVLFKFPNATRIDNFEIF